MLLCEKSNKKWNVSTVTDSLYISWLFVVFFEQALHMLHMGKPITTYHIMLHFLHIVNSNG